MRLVFIGGCIKLLLVLNLKLLLTLSEIMSFFGLVVKDGLEFRVVLAKFLVEKCDLLFLLFGLLL